MTRATQLRLLGLYAKAQGLLSADRAGQVALATFLNAPPPNITPKQAAFFATARHSRLAFNGEQIALYEWGAPEAPYVYTAYGWGYNAGRWRHFAPPIIAAGYRLVGFDYPGHGHSSGTGLDYPTLLGLHAEVLRHFGKPKFALTHSFGAGTFTESISKLSPALWPERVALMAAFSDAYFIFRQYADALGFGESHYASLDRAVKRRTGFHIEEFDPARAATHLGALPALIAHDPDEQVTSYSNALRLHAHWPNSLLMPSRGSGHGFSDADQTSQLLTWLLKGVLPQGVQNGHDNPVQLPPSQAHTDMRSVYFRESAENLG